MYSKEIESIRRQLKMQREGLAVISEDSESRKRELRDIEERIASIRARREQYRKRTE